jgi:hypothetical protein
MLSQPRTTSRFKVEYGSFDVVEPFRLWLGLARSFNRQYKMSKVEKSKSRKVKKPVHVKVSYMLFLMIQKLQQDLVSLRILLGFKF